jgi:hypothetical protein
MSNSPFLSVANAKLTLKVSRGSLDTDAWGNVVPTQETITILALLQELKKSGTNLPTNYRKEGLDINTKVLEGFLVEPLELPLSVRTPCIGTAEIRLATNRLEIGKFELMLPPQNPFVVSAGVKDVTKIIVKFQKEDVREI